MPNIVDRYKKNIKRRLLPADKVVDEMDAEFQESNTPVDQAMQEDASTRF